MPGRNQLRLAGVEIERRIEAGAQIEARRARRGALRQRQVLADSRVQDLELDAPGSAGHGQALS